MAREFVRQHNSQASFYENLLTIVCKDEFNSLQKQVASTLLYTQFKRLKEDNHIPKLSIELVKNNIIQVLVTLTDDPVAGTKNAISDIMSILIETEFPGNWKLGDQIMTALRAATEPKMLYAPLISLKNLIASYDRSLTNDRAAILEPILTEFFPYIENLAGVQLKNWNHESAVILNIILECFKSAHYLQLSNYLKVDEVNNWMQICGQVLNNPLSDDETSILEDWDDIVERQDSSHFWIAKITSMEIIYSIFRHCKPSMSETNFLKEFQNYFNNTFATMLIDQAFMFVSNYFNFYIPPKIIANCLRIIKMGIYNPVTEEGLQSHLNTILFQYCIPLLRINSKDVEYWSQGDQKDFIYSDCTECEDHNMIKNAAGELMLTILQQNNSNDKFMAFEFVNFLAFYFKEQKNPITGEALTHKETEYLLKALEVSGQYFSQRANYKSCLQELEQLINFVVVPLLSSEHQILRYRACSVIEAFGPIPYQQEETYTQICFGLCSNMQHEKLAIQVKSVLALDYFLMNETVKKMLTGDVKTIFNCILELLSKIELDSLVEALQSVSQTFSDQIEDYVEGIITQLKESYISYKKSFYDNKQKGDTEDDDDSDDAHEVQNAAEVCLEAIGNILNANLSGEVYHRVSPIILDLLNTTLVNREVSDSELCFGFINIILYKTRKGDPINDEIMFYYPIIVYFIKGFPQGEFQKDIKMLPDYLQNVLKIDKKMFGNQLANFEEITSVLLNYMSKMGTTFLDADDVFNNSFPDLLMDLIKEVGSSSLKEESPKNLYMSLRLAIGLLENFPGEVDNYLPQIITMTKEIMDYAVERQNSSPIMAKKLTNVKLQACQVLCMCFWYNETLTMKYIDSQKGYDILIKDLIDCLHLFTSDFEKERALYAFNGMCKLEPNLWPQVIFFLDTLGS